MFGWTNNEKLLKAAQNGNLIEVQRFIEEELTDVNAELYGDKTPLFLALLNNHNEVADYLLERTDTALPAIKTAIRHGALPVVKYFIENGIIPANHQDEHHLNRGATLLHRAVKQNDLEMADYLISQGASLDAIFHTDGVTVTSRDFTPLQYARDFGYQKMTALLERYSYDPHPEQRSPAKLNDTTLTTEKLLKQQSNDDTLLQKTAEELGDVLKGNKELLQKLIVTGMLNDLIKSLPYDESLTFYAKVRPQIDLDGRKMIEPLIRTKRLESQSR